MTTPHDNLTDSLSEWIEKHVPDFLLNTSAAAGIDVSDQWTMPIIEDYVLVIGVKDMNDQGGGVFALTRKNTSGYRIEGLLASAMNM